MKQPPEIDLLSFERGTVMAPAGCGKTQLITDTLKTYTPSKPVLVLTHTNAGVAALRSRLLRAGVSAHSYRVLTIDGWAMRLISTFPARSGHDPCILKLTNPSSDYPAIREAAGNLLNGSHLNDALRATYSRVFVDEYQDCSIPQHAIVSFAASVLPTCVLGDPMQAIFNFRGNQLVNWDNHVCQHFPLIGELRTPWRWCNAGTERLGRWLLDARALLMAGQGIDLRMSPDEVAWIKIEGETAHQQRLTAAKTRPIGQDGNVLVIGDSTSPLSQRTIASQTPGATAVEAVDLRDLTTFGQTFMLTAEDALQQLLNFASQVMTNVGATEFLRRVQSLDRGSARLLPSAAESAARIFNATPTYIAALNVLARINENAEVRVFRPGVLRACRNALRLASDGTISFHEATLRAREQYRHMGQTVSRRAVGSTLLLKGLEAEVVVVLSPERMDSKHLYVAITRGAKKLVICSATPFLRPS